jgi:hypothetical protein
MKEIHLVGKHGQGKVALVDDEDYERISQWRWFAVTKGDGNFYAMRSGGLYFPSIPIHREILGLTDSNIFVDHKDHNGLNNQRNNIRPCNRSENGRNLKKQRSIFEATSSFKGVHFDIVKKKHGYWNARILAPGNKRKNLGHCAATPCGELLAAVLYDIAAEKYYGDFACLNFAQDVLSIYRQTPFVLSDSYKKYFNKVPKKTKHKKVINQDTGEIFKSAATVSTLLGVDKSGFTKKLRGVFNNNTAYKYL